MLNAHCWKLTVPLLATVCFALTTSAFEPDRGGEGKRFIPASLARVEIVLGRLQLSNEHFRIGAAFERTQLEDGRERTRSISISTYRGRPTLQFRDSGGDEHIHLSFKADRNVDIEQTVGRDQDSYSMRYHQTNDGSISLHVDFSDGRDSLEIESLSLWHLAMEEPRAFDAYMLPCLCRLEPSWQIARMIETVRGIKKIPLLKGLNGDAEDFNRLIKQLDAELSAERTAAMSQLESMGVAAEPRLRQCLTTQLTSQQEQSVKRLLNGLQPSGNDTPMRIAIWLSDDLK